MSTFGPNTAYINELYYEFLKNPDAFDATWREFFAQRFRISRGEV